MAGNSGRRKNIRVKAKLKVRFKDVSAFITEYTHNISKGGLFIRSKKMLDQGSIVEVIIIMPETGREISAIGEVIHTISVDEATDAQPSGIGIEIKEFDPEDQRAIEEFIKEKRGSVKFGDGLGRRKHGRVESKIRVRFSSVEALIEEYTHNISNGGIFIRTRNPKEVGDKVKIILSHPDSGDEMMLDGEVVRAVKDEEADSTGEPPGMGVHFLSMDKYTRVQLEAFINPSDSEANTWGES